MRLYLASRWGRKLEMAEIARTLEDNGAHVTSHWVEEPKMSQDDGSYSGGSWNPDPVRAAVIAARDLSAVDTSDSLVIFTDESRSGYTGGRHVEFGYAYAHGKPCIVVGPRTNPFHYLADAWFEDTDAFIMSVRESATLKELIAHGS